MYFAVLYKQTITIANIETTIPSKSDSGNITGGKLSPNTIPIA